MRGLVLSAAVLTLAACERAAPPTAPASLPATAVASASAGASAPAKPAAVHKAVVDAGGIGIGKNPGTAARFPFGAERAAVEAAADRWLGTASERTRNDECGAGPMEFTRYGQLTLNFEDGKFAGWLLAEEPRAVTSDGIRPGALMRDLQVTRSVTMMPDSTLDGEFSYTAADGQQIGGFAAGKGRDAKIVSLYAGTTCFFR